MLRGALLLRQTLSRPLLLRLRYVTLIAAIADYVQYSQYSRCYATAIGVRPYVRANAAAHLRRRAVNVTYEMLRSVFACNPSMSLLPTPDPRASV